MSRLESPDVLFIEQRGEAVTISPSNAPGDTFAADGRERSVRVANGRMVSARATLNGGQSWWSARRATPSAITT
jgi:hypothetical protein